MFVMTYNINKDGVFMACNPVFLAKYDFILFLRKAKYASYLILFFSTYGKKKI